MSRRRVLAIGLDGYEISLAESMMAQGLLPHMRALQKRSARFALDHGQARYSGLAWEHVSTGLSPEAIRRWSAVTFDPQSYKVAQVPTSAMPFTARLSSRVVVLDLPYCDLGKAPNTLGFTNWGAHDPGVAPQSRPDGLLDEIEARFGPYPATDYIYGFTWPSVEKTELAAAALKRAVDVRAASAAWLLKERLPEWDLAMVVVSEAHSAIEQMWHGIDRQHDVSGAPSAAAARNGLHAIYAAIDDLTGLLMDEFPDADVVLFAMHGMGSNGADIASMALLGELLFRKRFGRPYMREEAWAARLPSGAPALPDDGSWHFRLEAMIPPLWHFKPPASGIGEDFVYARERDYAVIEWMPVTRYRPFWPEMDAFALPSFYDGRVRINLEGRESRGTVSRDKYADVLSDVRKLLADCREPRSGMPVLESMIVEQRDPYDIGPTQPDLYIHWKGTPIAFTHPELGQIGPLPYRRTGGHTNPLGFAYISGPGWRPADYGVRNSLDIVPTVIAMLGERDRARELSGEPISPHQLGRTRSAAA
ncbi:MAG TPA: hypothetical protein VLV55_04405 [Rhizomicrobium sp.]|nr:hypothetical protein [Rhizomicrobium sp.]